MKVDTSKIGKIGIDRIVLSNFKILNFEMLEKKEIVNTLEYIERIEVKDKLYNLIFSNNLKSSGEVYTVSSLEFNPNKIRDNHNLYNSSIDDLLEALDKVIFDLTARGIQVDFRDVKIKELEINITIPQSFEELEEVILLIGRANYTKALGIYSFLNEDIPTKIKKDRCLYLNSKLDFKRENTGKVIKLYDKTFEMYINQRVLVSEELTRIEVMFGRDYYRNTMEKLGYSNDLQDFLTANVLEDIFIESIKNELITKPMKYLSELKKNLTYDFNNFRRNEKLKRIEREKLKKAGKRIPEYLREERGVFEYLKKESWIFDYSFLYEIIDEHISTRHRKEFEKQITKKYMNINNKHLYEELLRKVFSTRIFLPAEPKLLVSISSI